MTVALRTVGPPTTWAVIVGGKSWPRVKVRVDSLVLPARSVAWTVSAFGPTVSGTLVKVKSPFASAVAVRPRPTSVTVAGGSPASVTVWPCSVTVASVV